MGASLVFATVILKVSEPVALLPSVAVTLTARTPTFALTIDGKTSHSVTKYLAKHGIFAWSGHFYAMDVVRSYGLEKDGLLRVGLLHYNTKREIKEFISVLKLLS